MRRSMQALHALAAKGGETEALHAQNCDTNKTAHSFVNAKRGIT